MSARLTRADGEALNGDARETAPPPAELPETYAGALRRRWPLVALGAVIAAAAGLLVSLLVLPTVYRSSATVIVNNTPQAAPADGAVAVEPFVDDQSLGETFAQLAVQPAVVERVAREVGLRPAQLVERVDVHALPRTPLVQIRFEGATPTEAARGAQAYTTAFVQSTRSNDFLPGRVLVVSAATLPDEPVGPRTTLNTVVAAAAGLLIGLAVVLGRVSSRASASLERERGTWSRRTVAEWQPPHRAAPSSGIKGSHGGG